MRRTASAGRSRDASSAGTRAARTAVSTPATTAAMNRPVRLLGRSHLATSRQYRRHVALHRLAVGAWLEGQVDAADLAVLHADNAGGVIEVDDQHVAAQRRCGPARADGPGSSQLVDRL